MADVTVLYFWRVQRRHLPFVLLSMAIDRRRIRAMQGVTFAKLLGTGRGEKFTPSDADSTKWGALIVIDESKVDQLDNSAIIKSWRARARKESRLLLTPIASHGSWAKKEPFTPGPPQEGANVVAITRARIKWRDNFTFFSAVPAVVEDLHGNDGLVAAFGIGEAPIGLQGTFSMWRDGAALKEFAYRTPAHQEVIATTHRRKWYAEELFARFSVRHIRGDISDI